MKFVKSHQNALTGTKAVLLVIGLWALVFPSLLWALRQVIGG